MRYRLRTLLILAFLLCVYLAKRTEVTRAIDRLLHPPVTKLNCDFFIRLELDQKNRDDIEILSSNSDVPLPAIVIVQHETPAAPRGPVAPMKHFDINIERGMLIDSIEMQDRIRHQ